MAKSEKSDLPKYIMLNPRYAAMWEDEVSGVKLNRFKPENIYAKTPTNTDCTRIYAALAVGRLIGLAKASDRFKHLKEAHVEVPLEPPDEQTKVQLRDLLKARNFETVSNTIRTIRDERMLRWMLQMEIEGDNTIGRVRGSVVDVIKSQINMSRGPMAIEVEELEDDEEEEAKVN